jgi:PAS domain S-box-containing protein
VASSHIRVLIVDDEYYLGQMLAQALISEKIESIAVTEVNSALNWLKKKAFDLVVSDIYLPVKSGVDLFNFIRKQKIDVPCIFMTGNPNLETAVELLTKGGYDYIIKPFTIPDFIKKVKSVISSFREKREEKTLVKDLRSLLDRRLSEIKIYQDIFESTEDGLVITDVDGIIVRVNKGFEQITGMTSVQLLQQPLSILENGLLPDLKSNEIYTHLRKENTFLGEYVGKRGLNETWYTSVSFSTIRDENKKNFAFAAIFKDVTPYRKVEQELIHSLRNTNLAQEAIIFGLASLAEHRDNTTGYHLERIRNYCKVFAEEILVRKLYPKIINEEFIKMLYRTAPLHDIGKVGIPDEILLKKAKLTKSEFDSIKAHTIMGYNTLFSIQQEYGEMPFLKMGIELSYCHHERWDGTGYPRGLKGDKIPLSAQILAITDVYDALTTERSYKKAYSHDESMEELHRLRGKHFSPKLLDIFLDISDQIKKIKNAFSENGKVRSNKPLSYIPKAV